MGNSFSQVFDELLESEILPRLALGELLRLRCVCKRWRDIIFDPYFVKRHEQYNQGRICSSYLVTLNSSLPIAVLNLLTESPSWIQVVSLSRPGFVLVSSCGGLLCYARSTYIKEEVSELDFIVCNPITGQSTQLPTLHTRLEPVTGVTHMCLERFTGVSHKPYVSMTMRQGRLHQLWVVHGYGIYIYDTSMSQHDWNELFQQADVKYDKLYLPGDKLLLLQNSWVDIKIHTFFEPLLYWSSKMVFKDKKDTLGIIDTIDFIYTEAIWQDPSPFPEYDVGIIEFKGMITYTIVEETTSYLCVTLGMVNFITEDFCQFYVEYVVKCSLPWLPMAEYSLPQLLLKQHWLKFMGLGDMVYIMDRNNPQKALIYRFTTDENNQLCFFPPEELKQPADPIMIPHLFEPRLFQF